MYNGLITVRTQSSRLPKKCLLNISKYTLVIEHIILRCLKSDINPIICTTLNREDDILVTIAKKFGISVKNLWKIKTGKSWNNLEDK